jgi:hypothetical protein
MPYVLREMQKIRFTSAKPSSFALREPRKQLRPLPATKPSTSKTRRLLPKTDGELPKMATIPPQIFGHLRANRAPRGTGAIFLAARSASAWPNANSHLRPFGKLRPSERRAGEADSLSSWLSKNERREFSVSAA